MSAMSDLDLQIRKQLELIDAIQLEKSEWLEENTDEYGDSAINDEDWNDGLNEFNESLALLGVDLAQLVRQAVGE